MHAFLTGANGFIGSHLLERLLTEHHQVTILTRPSSDLSRIKHLLDKVFRIHETELEKYFSADPPELIFHLATLYVKSHQSQDVSRMIESNVKLPSLITQLATSFGTKYFINVGTCFEFAPSDHPITEKDGTHPYNLYAATKIAFEELLQFYARNPQFKAMTLRLFYPYGEKDNIKVIPLMIDSLLRDEKLIITKGEQRLDYTYVGDIVESCLKAITFLESDKYEHYQSIHIGTSHPVTLKKIATILNKLHGKELIYCEKEYPPNEIMSMYADNSKAKRLLHWQPQTDIETGLKKVYQYYQHQRHI